MASIIRAFSSAASFVSRAVTTRPLAAAFGLVGACEAVSTTVTQLMRSIRLEMADVFSLLAANALTVVYYTQSARQVPQTILLSCTSAWALRLSSFLFRRTLRGFQDNRIDKMRGSLKGGLTWFAAQSVWVFITLLPIWVGMSARNVPKTSLKLIDYVSLIGFATGFVFEAVGDEQKSAFIAAKKSNDDKQQSPYCNTGLFSLCRFPNYFGEWLMWASLGTFSFRTSTHWTRYLIPISPVFVYQLLHQLSIQLAIKKMKRRISDDDFKNWSRIPLFFPRPHSH